ncbi:hypothetical protein [Silvibacterium dinghuense]|uniref:Uncharacterized protein n=1 Tax=Silvibacterium dinghuense TaxID=1560006 RepID=A0A4Q1SBN8_9BACT|nr:hypothetical protein [Silvibacterium dinghuense]RXS94413.1 hypothetical protein ESZ00_15165 [Silvibacterium dinghuense]GGH16277.1 hypothetical protein GCM10011586_37980 [Silvibacterium dinghuense]
MAGCFEERFKEQIEGKMTNPQKVYVFLKENSGQAFCDDCIERAVGVDRHQVHTIAATLGLFPLEFKRCASSCASRCADRDKQVTMAI